MSLLLGEGKNLYYWLSTQRYKDLIVTNSDLRLQAKELDLEQPRKAVSGVERLRLQI